MMSGNNPAYFQSQRLAEGLAILSLDLVCPVYPCLDLAPLEPMTLQPLLRRAILENRAEFARDPTVVPDLRRRTIKLVRDRLGDILASALDVWLGSTLIAGPDDYRRYTYLQDVLRTDSAWPLLTIPERLRPELAKQIADQRSCACFDALYPDDDENLTEWDAEIFTRMRFYEEFNDPYDFVYLTCGWIDFRRSLEWFISKSSVAEQLALCESVKTIGFQTESPSRTYDMMPLQTVVRRHA